MKLEELINTAIKEGKLVMGSKRCLKELKRGNLKYIVIASNAPQDVRAEVVHTAGITKTKVLEFEGNSKELGTLCRKPFFVAVAGVK